jgi:deoxyribonuclease-4
MAGKLRGEARKYNIILSVHAPYYINLASEDNRIIINSENYIFSTSTAAKAMGADRVVLHPGSVGKMDRHRAFSNVKRNLYNILQKLKDKNININLCPETMGKKNQIGTLDEILELCLLDKSLIPTLDFGHLHAINSGALNNIDDFRRVFDKVINTLGDERGRKLHIHYSRIEFTEKAGEKKHWTYTDSQYGPEFEPLAECLLEYGISATIICESRGTMAEDAISLSNIYKSILNKNLFKLENL